MKKSSKEGKLQGSRRVTLADVAAKAGVDAATASQVLNDRPNCWASEATRQRIRDAAEALDYRPNLAARALRSGKTGVIGLISPGFATGSPHSRADGLTDAALKADYTVTLSSHPNDSVSEDMVIRRLLDRGVDGLAIYPVDPGPHTELRRLVASGFPVVTFEGANLLDLECDDISVDTLAVGRRQARHLLSLGRRRICLANTKPMARIVSLREKGIREELVRAGKMAPIEMLIEGPASHEIEDAETREVAMKRFLEEHRGEFDGIIGGDQLASMAIRFLQEMGVRVPEDVAVIGGGDSILATYGIVPMTSVCAAGDLAGAKAFGLLMDRISGKCNGSYRRLTNPAKLVVRKSTQV
ncbi:MAG: LacI family DNA-binding transcriptional regulator [bacterium]